MCKELMDTSETADEENQEVNQAGALFLDELRIDAGVLTPFEPQRSREIVGGLPIGLRGVFYSNTSDRFVFENDKQVLSTASSELVVDKDGSFSGDIKNVSRKALTTRVELEDGTEVLLDEDGIARVEHALPTNMPGTFDLTTGDKLSDSGQSLLTQDGNKIKVREDGSVEVNGHKVSELTDFTLVLDGGIAVQIKDKRIVGLRRDGIEAKICSALEEMDPTTTRTSIRFFMPEPHDGLDPNEGKTITPPAKELPPNTGSTSTVKVPLYVCIKWPCTPEDHEVWRKMQKDRMLRDQT